MTTSAEYPIHSKICELEGKMDSLLGVLMTMNDFLKAMRVEGQKDRADILVKYHAIVGSASECARSANDAAKKLSEAKRIISDRENAIDKFKDAVERKLERIFREIERWRLTRAQDVSDARTA